MSAALYININYPPSPCWTCTNFHVNIVSLEILQRTQCQLTLRIFSMLCIHTACSTQKLLPAARVWFTHCGT